LDGKKSKVTENSRRIVFNYGRALLRGVLDRGSAEQIGLDRGFIAAMPVGGPGTPRSRNPFPDEVARALADEANLRQLADGYDPHDRGLRDVWETIIVTGRRASEVIQLRLDCVRKFMTDGAAFVVAVPGGASETISRHAWCDAGGWGPAPGRQAASSGLLPV
jgi:integrase